MPNMPEITKNGQQTGLRDTSSENAVAGANGSAAGGAGRGAAPAGLEASAPRSSSLVSQAGAACPSPEEGVPVAADGSAGLKVELEPSDVNYNPPLIECLVLLFKLLGKVVSPSFLLSGLPIAEGVLRPSALIRAARLGGMHAKTVYRPTLGDISPLTLPCILLLKNNKACVLSAIIDDKHVEVYFPENAGLATRITMGELAEEYTGYAIFGQLEGKLDTRASNLKLLKTKRWFWGTLTHFMPIYKHVLMASVIVNLLATASPLFFMNVYDRVVPNGEHAYDTLWVLALGIAIAYLFDFLLKNLRSYFVDVAGKNADIILASRLMHQLMNLKLDAKPDSTGSLANNLREFESLREFFGSSTLLALVDIPFLLLFIFIIAAIGGPLAIVPIVAVPIVIITGLLSQYSFQRAVEASYKENTQKNALLVEIINGLETVKTCMAEGRMQRAWEKVIGMNALSSSRIKFLSNLSLNTSILATQMVSVIIIVWGVIMISNKELSMGGLIACNMMAGRAMAPLSQIASMLSRLQQSRMALKSLDMLMELPVERPDEKQYVDFGELPAALTLDQVMFKYPNSERFSLSNVRVQINPGEKVGVIGRMGSGKSTLGRLCVGLYEPTEGAVKLGGVDIRQLDVADLRARVGYVSQDNYLFFGSVRDNIALGMPHADDRMILRAATVSGVIDFIRTHPAGFGMPVGERGMNLSGGQRQSVAIARALLHDPDILIMDEPSSNMDNGSENMFKQRLATIMGDKTLVIITHRLSMLDLVDRLIVIDSGQVLADGPKDAVLNALRNEQIQAARQRKPQAATA